MIHRVCLDGRLAVHSRQRGYEVNVYHSLLWKITQDMWCMHVRTRAITRLLGQVLIFEKVRRP